MNIKIKGQIKKISEVKKGLSKKDNKPWSSMSYLVETAEQYNNTYSIDVFQMDGAEHKNVDKFLKFNKIGDSVEAEFNIRTQEYNDRDYTSLSHWRIEKVDAHVPSIPTVPPVDMGADSKGVGFDDLPF